MTSSPFERFSTISNIASQYLDGPRSVMLPHDPNGLEFWLEPVIRSHLNCPTDGVAKSLIVYAVPNCVERHQDSPILLRHADWEAGKDRGLCRMGSIDSPTVTIGYTALTADQVLTVDMSMHKLDQSFQLFSFPVEGLDLASPSGIKAVQKHVVIAPRLVHYKVCRITRFCYIELRWQPNETAPSHLDQCFQSLFDLLIGMIGTECDVVEKYDIDPKDYGRLIN